jgi:hypothetical protein
MKILKRDDNIVPIPGELYEFANQTWEENWTRPIPFIGNVPPSMKHGQFLYVVYNEIVMRGSRYEMYEFVREVTLDKTPIPYKDALSRIRLHDEVRINLNGEGLRVGIVSMENILGQLYYGLWDIEIQTCYEEMLYKDFRIVTINGVEVLPPININP